jgi:hypothetical protein
MVSMVNDTVGVQGVLPNSQVAGVAGVAGLVVPGIEESDEVEGVQGTGLKGCQLVCAV